VLDIECLPLEDVALVLAPSSGVVAVVDARARTVIEGLRDGRDEGELARALAIEIRSDMADAAAHVAALRAMWVDLAAQVPIGMTTMRPPLENNAPALDMVCRAGAAPVRLRIWPARLARLVGAVIAAAQDSAAAVHGDCAAVAVHRIDGGYVLFADGRHLLTTTNFMIARSETLRRLVLASHPGREWLAVLHSAAVAGMAGAALLCGSSGAGKSTLTGCLVASGLELVTDDYGPIEAATRLLWPVPFGLSVKERSWPLLAPHFPDLSAAAVIRTRTRQRRQRYVSVSRMATRPQPIRCLVFPLYRAGEPLELTKLRPGEALELLGRSGGWYESSRERLAELVDWVGGIPAYALSYGHSAGAVAAVRGLLTG
jgi:hypothetical protein